MTHAKTQKTKQPFLMCALEVFLLGCFLCCAQAISSQSYNVLYDNSGANIESSSETYVTPTVNGFTSAIPIGFDFEFYGNTYNNLYIGENGLLTFTGGQNDFSPGAFIPSTGNVNNFIALTWIDLDTYDVDISYEVFGTAPDRRFVATWSGLDNCGGSYLFGQIKLLESNYNIELHLEDWNPYGYYYCYATQGIENADGSVADYLGGRVSNDYWSAYGDLVTFQYAGSLPDNDASTINLVQHYCDGLQDIKVGLTNSGGNDIDSVQINWSWNGVIQTPFNYQNTLPVGVTAVTQIGTQTLTTGQKDTLLVWTSLPNGMSDPNTANDTTQSFVTIGISGQRTVGGTNPDYVSLSQALADIDSTGICDTLYLNIRDGIYNEQLSINYFRTTLGDPRLIIQSESQNPTAVEINFNSTSFSNNYTIRFHQSARKITLKDLTIKALGTTYGRVIEMEYATDIEISNCIIEGLTTTSSGTQKALIFSESYLSNIKIQNCQFNNGSIGFSYNSDFQSADQLHLNDNQFNNCFDISINSYEFDNIEIQNNTIVSDAINHNGILIYESDGDSKVLNNYVYLSNGQYGIFINNENSSPGPSSCLIANNMVVMEGNNTICGLGYNENPGFDYYHNTVLNRSNNSASSAFLIGFGSGNNVKNNIFINEAKGTAIKRTSTFATNDLDYNDIYSFGDTLGISGTTAYPDLSSWNTATSWDANSISVNPFFTSPTDLHVSNVLLDSAGIAIASVSTDFDGEARNLTHPDIGADEFGGIENDASPIAILPNMIFKRGLNDVKAIIRNGGSNDINSLNINWSFNGITQTPVQFTGSLEVGLQDTIVLGSQLFELLIPYQIEVWTDTPNGNMDSNVSNDSTMVDSLFAGVSGDILIGSLTADLDSIGHAFKAMELGGIADTTNFLIQDGSYSGNLQFSELPSMSCDLPITFTSLSGNASDVEINNDGLSGNVLTLDGADGLIFKDLTFKTNTANHVLEFYNNSNCNRFESCIFNGFNSTSTTATEAVIYSDSGIDTTNTFIDNQILNGSYGIYWDGGVSYSNEIVSNEFLNQYNAGIYAENQREFLVSENTFASSSTNTYAPISLRICVFNVLVEKNIINMPNNNVTAAINWSNSTSSATDPIILKNNVIQLEGTGSGIYLLSVNNLQIYNNTIIIKGSVTGSQGVFVYSGNNISLLNNLIANYSNGRAISSFGTITQSNYNNLFSLGTNLITNSGIAYSDLSSWQATGKDANSISVDPMFIPSNSYHPSNAAMDGQGTPLTEVTDDIQGDTRDLLNPDMGADEFSLVTDDVGIVSINYPTFPFPAGDNTIYIKFTNNGNDTLTSMKVNYEINDIAQSEYTWTGILPSAGTYDSLDIGSFFFETDSLYKIKAWVGDPNGVQDGLASNDTLIVDSLYPALSGTYTIGGTDPDFETIADAIVPLQLGGAAGPVTFNIRDGVYWETISLSQFPGSECGNNVIFQSESGDSSKVEISNFITSDYPVRLVGVDGLTFKNLTLKAENPSFGNVIHLSGGSDCNNIYNCKIVGLDINTTSLNSALVYSASGLDTANIYENCLLEKGSYGFYLRNSNAENSNTKIENNDLKTNYYGIYMYQNYGSKILNNKITVDHPTSAGIYLDDCDNGLAISNNQIASLSGRYGIYLFGCNGGSANPLLISNNFSSVGGSGIAYPFFLWNCSNVDLAFNNVHVYTTSLANTNATLSTSGSTSGIRLYNNNMSNLSSNGTILKLNSNGIADASHNNYYSTGSAFIDLNGTAYADLATWQTASSVDANSISTNPQYMSDTDLHVSSILLKAAGLPYAGINTDIDGDIRNSTTPDIGADEFIPLENDDAGIFSYIGPTAPFASGVNPVTVTLKNFGANNLTSVNVRWLVNGLEQSPFSWTGNLDSGICDSITIGTFNFEEYSKHDLVFWTELPNALVDSTNVNDTLNVDNVYPALSGAYTVGGSLPDFDFFIQVQDALNNGGIIDDVIFNIRDGLYNEQFRIKDFPRISATDSVILKPESSNPYAVHLTRSFNASNYTIQLDKAHHVKFQDLKISSPLGRAIEITNGAHAISLIKNQFQGSTNNSSNQQAIIYSGTSSEDNIEIADNQFLDGAYGIYLTASSGDREKGNVIHNNFFNNQKYDACYLTHKNGIEISANEIHHQNQGGGLKVYYSDSTFNISSNLIYMSNGGTGIDLYANAFSPSDKGEISNNYIHVGGTVRSFGIRTSNTEYIDILFNTIRVDNPNVQSGLVNFITAAISLTSNPKGNIANNILSNFGGGITMYYPYTGAENNYDNNCLFTTGPNLAYSGGFRTDLSDLQANTSTQSNSISIDPLLLDINSPAPLQVALNEAADNSFGINLDYEGETRSSSPDIGADEFIPVPNDIGIKLLSTPNTFCGLSNSESIEIEIQNFGSQVQTGFNVSYAFDGNAWVTDNVGALLINPGETAMYTFSQNEDLSSVDTYTFSFYTDLSTDQDRSNDTLWNVEVEHIPALVDPVVNLIPIDGSEDLEKNVSLSWSPTPNAILYDIYLWKSTEVKPASPQITDLSQINYLYNNLDYGTIYKWQVVAKNECNQMEESAEQEFTVRYLPDLMIDTVIAPSAAFSGQTIAVTWAVKNIGSGKTQSQQWTDAIYLSTDATMNTSLDYYLGGVQNLTALDSNQVYSNTSTFTIPQGLTGDFYVFAFSDRFTNLPETDNNNNWKNSPVTMMINLTPSPDLKVEAIGVPTNSFSGQNINISYNVKNIGLADTDESEWIDKIYLSDDPFSAQGGMQIGTIQRTGILKKDSLYNIMLSATIPENIFGDQYVHVFTDANEEIYENAAEANNKSVSDTINIILTPPPDLGIDSMFLADTATSNDLYEISYRLENYGGSTISEPNWDDYIYLSKAPIYFPNALVYLGSNRNYGPMPPGDNFLTGRNFTIPKHLNGEYYVYVVLDRNDKVFEHTFENNNIVRSANKIFIATPDIEPIQLNSPSNTLAGATELISANIVNNGLGDLVNQILYATVYISPFATFEESNATELETKFIYNQTLRNDTTSIEVEVDIPDGISGVWYVHYLLDEPAVINEGGQDQNNVISAPINIILPPYPDLIVSNSILPDSALIGDTLALSITASNIGAGPANPSINEIYISTTSSWDPSFAKLLGVDQVSALAVSQQELADLKFFLTPSLSSTLQYVYAVVDAEEDAFENLGESNNIQLLGSVYLKPSPPIDLALSAVSMPDTVWSGTEVSTSWIVTNNSSIPPFFDTWSDGVYISNDSILDISIDASIYEEVESYSLSAGSNESKQISLPIPDGLEGAFYFYPLTDVYDANVDIDRTNNHNTKRINGTAKSVYIKLSTSPDLIPSSFISPAEVISGQPFDIMLSINNGGNADAAQFTSKIYLSTDDQIGSGDLLLAETFHDPLSIGSTITDTISVGIPSNQVGNQILIVKLDPSDQIYEHLGESNNVLSRTFEAIQPPPSDLTVTAIALPDSASAGSPIDINWKTSNIGANPASGIFREIVYLSDDDVLDINDAIFSILDEDVYIPPGSILDRSINANIQGVSEGDIYAIIQTDARDQIFESNDTNNITSSLDQMNVSIEELYLDTLTCDSIYNASNHYFKIEIASSFIGENLKISVEGDSIEGLFNEVYLKYGEVPTLSDFDATYLNPFDKNQVLIHEDLIAGTYYILIKGQDKFDNGQKVNILAEIIDFEVISVAPNRAANTGQITLALKGTELDEMNEVLLLKDSTHFQEADTIYIIDKNLAYATFDLSETPPQIYDVAGVKSNGQMSIISNGLEVIEDGEEPNLQVIMTYPSTVGRRNAPMKITVFIFNSGDNDLLDKNFEFVSLFGNQLALTYDDLINGNTQETIEIPAQNAFGPPGILSAKSGNSIEVFAWTLPHPSFALKPKN